MSRARGIGVRVLLMATSLAICVAVAEGALRLKNASMKNYDIEMWRYARTLKCRSENPILGHDHVPSSKATLQSVEIRTNEFGLRGGPVPPPNEKRRILFLGSSITLGWGVAEDDTVTARLQKMFEKDGHETLVLNAGIGNYNAERYVERYLTKLTDLKPTDIVVHAFVRDAEVLEAGGGNWLLQNSQLSVVAYAALQRQRAGTGMGNLTDHYRKIYATDSPGLKSARTALQRLSEHAHKNNIRLYMAMTPDIHNLENYPLGFVHDAFRDSAKEYDYRYVDLLPAFEGVKAEDIWAMPGDPHPNAFGHQKMAEAIYPILALPETARVR